MLFAPADSECQDLTRPDDVFSLADFWFFSKTFENHWEVVFCADDFTIFYIQYLFHLVPLLRYLVPVILVNFIFFVARLRGLRPLLHLGNFDDGS